jgi:PAS domain S-box-containing protein
MNKPENDQSNRDHDVLLSEMTNMVPGVVYQFYARPNGEMGFYYISPKSAQVIGLKPELEGYLERFAQLIIPEHREGFVKSIEKSVKESTEWIYEGILQKPSGEKIWFSGNSIPSPREDEIVFNGIVQDITERKRSSDFLQLVVNNIPDFVFWKDRQSVYLGCNNAFAKVAGVGTVANIIGKTDYDLKWKKEESDFFVATDRKVMETNQAQYHIIEPQLQADGKQAWLETCKVPLHDGQGQVIGILGTYMDITERKRTEEELRKTQKLESLGLLAGGIAHDFNNLLAGIFGYIDLARSVSKDGQAKEYLEATLSSMNRARALTLQLLTFAKGGAPVQKVTSLISFLRETTQFVLSGSNVSCKTSLPEDLWPCIIDKNQIGQVIDNIVINAKQAMPNGGAIEITAKNISLGEKEHSLLAKGDYVRMSIKDSGIGIPKDVMPHIFDPFYTTKTQGHGLGLATCYSIIKRHGGAIDVESEPSKGSTFHVYLPASPEDALAETTANGKHRGTGTILVMDDEEVILTSTRKMLEMMGYDVVCMNDGKAVLDFFASEIRAGRTFSGMLLDLTIPGGMGGIEAVAEVRKQDREIPVMVLSGYSDDSVLKTPGKYGFTASLSKPFTIAELSEMLNKYMKPKK